MIRIYLNSVANSTTPINAPSLWLDVTNECNGISDLKMKFSRKDDVVQRGITNDLVFFDGAYDLLYDRLVVNLGEHVWVKIDIDGFAYTFPYLQIRWNAIEWCSNKCEISATLTTWNEDLDKYKLLKSTLIWDVDFLNNLVYNNPFTGQSEDAHPLMRVRWADGGVGAINQFNWGLIGVYIRHYFYNICHKTNLIPRSSIFDFQGLNAWTGDNYDDIYYNVPFQSGVPQAKEPRNPYHFSAVFLNIGNTSQNSSEYNFLKTGQSERPSPTELNNALNLNGIQFLDNFSQVFNARYRIRNGLLEFERKDYFFQTATIWQDLRKKDVCYKLKDQDNWAYLRLEYGQESELWEGALLERGSLNYTPQQVAQIYPPFPKFAEKYYNEIVEWNDPVSTRQEGELSRVLPFANLRTKINGVDRDDNLDRFGLYVKTLNANTPFLACVRSESPMNRKNIYQTFDFIQSSGQWQEFYNRPFYAKKESEAELDSGTTYEINWKGTLYENFHFIDDPRRRPNNSGYEAKEPYKKFEYEMNIDFDCEMLDNFDLDNFIEIDKGRAMMDEVEFDFKTLQVNIKGFV